jgi:hypothetical protein
MTRLFQIIMIALVANLSLLGFWLLDQILKNPR